MNKYLKIDRKALKETLEQAGMKVISLRAQHDCSFSLSIEDAQYALPVERDQLFKALLPFGRMFVLMPGGYDWRIAIVESEITTETVGRIFKALATVVHLAKMFDLSPDELARRAILTDLDTVATAHVEGSLVYHDEAGRFYYLPENPFVMYMMPIGPSSAEPIVDIEHGRWLLSNDREGIYKLYMLTPTQDIDGRILAIDRESSSALVQRFNKLTIEPASEQILVWCIAPSEQRVSYSLDQDWYGPAVSVEVFPNRESWSSIRVSYRSAYRADYQAQINWYSTSGGLVEGRAFYAAYGKALEIAHQLDAMELTNE